MGEIFIWATTRLLALPVILRLVVDLRATELFVILAPIQMTILQGLRGELFQLIPMDRL